MSNASVIRFGANPPAAEKGKPGNVISGDPETSLRNYYTDSTGCFFAGVWESTVGKWPVKYSEDEFCVIRRGKVTLTAENGKTETFVAGDAFVIPSGFKGTWETIEPVRKFYAIHEKKA